MIRPYCPTIGCTGRARPGHTHCDKCTVLRSDSYMSVVFAELTRSWAAATLEREARR